MARRSAARSRKRVIDPSRYVQVGIRGPMYGEDEDFAFQRDQGVTTIDIGMVKRDGAAATMARVREIVAGRPLYVTFDIDSVDPAFAPGTGTPEVGGLTSYEAQELVRGLSGLNLVGCDVVEVAPAYDGPGQITALLAANLMFELLCVIAKDGSRLRAYELISIAIGLSHHRVMITSIMRCIAGGRTRRNTWNENGVVP